MKNVNTVMILVGILLSVVLIVENMIIPLNAYVLIWTSKTWMLSLVSIGTGILIGYGLHAKLTEDNSSSDDDSYGF